MSEPLETIATATTAAAAALATAAAATAESAATAATATAAAAESAAAARALLRLVDADLPAVEVRAVQLGDGVLRSLRVRHRDEREASRATRFAVRGERYLTHFAEGSECRLDRFLSRVERKISYEQPISHVDLSDFVRTARK